MALARNRTETMIRILDNVEKIGVVLNDNNGVPIDLTSLTVTFRMVDLNGGTAVVTGGATSKQPTTTFTAATTDIVTAVKHSLKDGNEVILPTDGTLPAGLSTLTRYFVRDANEDTFKLTTTEGGTAIDVTDTGSGTHAFAKVGHVTYSPAAGDVDTAGLYAMYFVDDSSPIRKWPYDGAKLRMKIITETEEIS